MKVTFTKTHEKGYGVSVEGTGIDKVTMASAPGYDPRLPHDVAHFIVENELGILGGIFGQIAAGGTANTFFSTEAKNKRKARRRGAEMMKANKNDALFSEHAVYAVQSRWEKHDIIPDTKISQNDLDRIAQKFEEFAAEWTKVEIGGSVTLEWKNAERLKIRR